MRSRQITPWLTHIGMAAIRRWGDLRVGRAMEIASEDGGGTSRESLVGPLAPFGCVTPVVRNLRGVGGPVIMPARVARSLAGRLALGERIMAVSETFRSLVLDQLARVAPAVRARRMFGALGIYAGDAFFALADQDRLYLKADDQTREQFTAQGWEPFRPFGDDRMTMQYYEVPLEVIENVERLRPWVDLALAAAKRGGKKKPRTTKLMAEKLGAKKLRVKKKLTERKSRTRPRKSR